MKTVVNVLSSWYDFFMRTSLFLFFVFIVVCVAVTLIGAMTYMLFTDCTLLTAGVSDTFFNPDFFIAGAAKFLPFAAVIACLFMTFYLIRHKGHPVMNIFIYAAIGAAVWLAVIPFSHTLITSVEQKKIQTVRPDLTSGYFRRQGPIVVYYARRSPVSPNHFSGTIIQADTESLAHAVEVSDFIEEMSPNSLFADQLYAENLQFPLFFRFIMRTVDGLRVMMRTASQEGSVKYLLFATIGAAYLSLIGLKKISPWKLFNVALILGFFFLISELNYMLYFSPKIQPVIEYAAAHFTIHISSRFVLTSIFNGLCSVVLIIIGTISSVRSRNTAEED